MRGSGPVLECGPSGLSLTRNQCLVAITTVISEPAGAIETCAILIVDS